MGNYCHANGEGISRSDRLVLSVCWFEKGNGLINQIEAGELESDKTRKIIEDALLPMLEKNIDTVVLGCTHYPFVIPLIQKIVGENVRVIDPAPAVAKQVERLLDAKGVRNSLNENGKVMFFTSGDVNSTENVISKLIHEKVKIKSVTWKNDCEINLKK